MEDVNNITYFDKTAMTPAESELIDFLWSEETYHLFYPSLLGGLQTGFKPIMRLSKQMLASKWRSLSSKH